MSKSKVKRKSLKIMEKIGVRVMMAGVTVQDWTVRRHWLQAKTKC